MPLVKYTGCLEDSGGDAYTMTNLEDGPYILMMTPIDQI